MLCSDVNIV